MSERIWRSLGHEAIRVGQAGRDRGRLEWRGLPSRIRIVSRGRWLGTWAWVTLGASLLGAPNQGMAKELHFVIHDVEQDHAVWLPREVLIHRHSDLTEPVNFRLENPTARTHVFEAPGLFESVEEGGVISTRPLRITIASEETMLIVLDRDRLADDVVGSEGATKVYRFYCPLHRNDADLGSRILLVP